MQIEGDLARVKVEYQMSQTQPKKSKEGDLARSYLQNGKLPLES